MLDGGFGFLVGEDTVPGGAGSCVHAPSVTLHTFKNVGTSPSRLLGHRPSPRGLAHGEP